MRLFPVVMLGLLACGDGGEPQVPDQPVVEVVNVDGTSASSVEIAPTLVGQLASVTLRVTNSGSAATGPIAISFMGEAANDFTLDNTLTTCAGLALAVGATCDVAINFRPGGGGLRAATIVISSDPGGTFMVPVSGNGLLPDVRFEPSSLIDLGDVETGTTAQTTIALHNDGTTAAPISAIAISGLGYAIDSNTCGGSVAAGTSCSIDVSFQPQALGDHSGLLSATSSGQVFSVPLAAHGARRVTVAVAGTGTGTVASTPAGIACPGTCTDKFKTAVTLTATPAANSAITSWSVPGCTGTTCAIPAGVGPVTVTATFTLQGTPDLHFNPASGIDFGDVEIGTTAQLTAELRNDGSASAPLGAFSVNGGYTLGGGSCGSSLAPNSSCDVLVSFSASNFGTYNATLSVISGGQPVSVPLVARAKRRITIVKTGAGSGTVTSAPAGINCGTGCTGLFDTDVVFTATPAGGSVLASWSACAGTSTCTIPNALGTFTLTVNFALPPSALDVTFAGDGAGTVLVREYSQFPNQFVNTYCNSSCTVPLQAGNVVRMYSATPQQFDGITNVSGACSSPANKQAAWCEFTAVSGAASATVTFNKHPNELWTRLVLPSQAIIAVAYDTGKNVVAASKTAIIKIASSGTTAWTRSVPVSGLATGPSGTIYLVSGTTIKKLDSAGNDMWTQPIPTGSQPNCTEPIGDAPRRCIAVALDGSVVVRGSTHMTRWDSAGTQTWSKMIGGSGPFTLIDASGIIYAGINSVFRRFQADGTELSSITLTSPSGTSMLDIAIIGSQFRVVWGSLTTVVRQTITIATSQVVTSTSTTVDIRQTSENRGVVAESSQGTTGELFFTYSYPYTGNRWVDYTVNGLPRTVIYNQFSLKEAAGARPIDFAHVNDGTTSQFVLVGVYESFSQQYFGGFVQALSQ